MPNKNSQEANDRGGFLHHDLQRIQKLEEQVAALQSRSRGTPVWRWVGFAVAVYYGVALLAFFVRPVTAYVSACQVVRKHTIKDSYNSMGGDFSILHLRGLDLKRLDDGTSQTAEYEFEAYFDAQAHEQPVRRFEMELVYPHFLCFWRLPTVFRSQYGLTI